MTDVEKVARAIADWQIPGTYEKACAINPLSSQGPHKGHFDVMAKAAIAACNEWPPIEDLPDEIKRDGTPVLLAFGTLVLWCKWSDDPYGSEGPGWYGWAPPMGLAPLDNPTRFHLIEGPDDA